MPEIPHVDAKFGGEGGLSVQDRLAAEADAIDKNPDAPITDRSTVTRGHGRSRVLQIRLNDAELAELERLAKERNLPPSTVAREAVLRLTNPTETRAVEGRRLAAELRRFVAEFMTGHTPAAEPPRARITKAKMRR